MSPRLRRPGGPWRRRRAVSGARIGKEASPGPRFARAFAAIVTTDATRTDWSRESTRENRLIAGYDYGPDTLTQVVADTAGQTYDLSFYLYFAPAGPTQLTYVQWNGATDFSEAAPTVGGFWEHFMTQVVGTGSDSLEFFDANNPGLDYLHNVSLTAGIPEASTWAMMMLGFAGLGFAGYRKTKRGEPVLSAA